MVLNLPVYENVVKLEIIKLLVEDLKIPVQQGYLMSRDRLGIPLRTFLIDQLRGKEKEVFLLDFRGVDEMTTSVAEELGPHLVENFLSSFYESKANNNSLFIIYCNLSKEVRNGLDTAMKTWPSKTNSTRKIVAVGFNQDVANTSIDFFVIGELPEALRETILQIYKLDEVKSSELDKLGIKASSRKLSELMEDYPWLVRQEKQRLSGTSKAWSYVYKPIIKIVRNVAI